MSHTRLDDLGVVSALVAGVGLVALLAVVHLAQGTADVGVTDLWRLVLGQGTDRAADVAVASRLPRLTAGLIVGVALGMAGAALQSVARNALASPDTLAVDVGAFLAITSVAVLGIALPTLLTGVVAFTGGLAAAGLVLTLSFGGDSGPTRMVLAGSAITMALAASCSVLLLLFAQETRGLFFWNNGSLGQIGFGTAARMAPVILVGCAGLMLLGRRLDLLALGDDTASVLGVDVTRTRALAVVGAVLLAAASVTVAGPIGFVGRPAAPLLRMPRGCGRGSPSSACWPSPSA